MKSGCVMLVVLALAASSSAATYYVAPPPAGADGNDGSDAHPWATLQHAADTVAAGDTVLVRAGSYTGFDLRTSGSETMPIVFQAEPGVTIDADNAETPDGINLEGASWVTIEGFTANGRTRAGIRAVTGEHVTLRGNHADQNGVWGIFTGFCDDLLVERNECSRSGDEHGIYVSNSGDRPTIRENLSWGNNGCGIHMNGDASMGGDGIISQALVERNVIHGNGAGGGSGINCDGVMDSVIRNNLLYGNLASGISLYQGDGAESGRNLVINNTVVQTDGRWCLNIQTSPGNRALNNILWNGHGFRGALDISSDSLVGFVSDYNVVIGRFSTDGGDSVLDLAGWRAASGQDANSMAITGVAEVFLDAPGDDYHLFATSVAVDHGTATDAPPTDLEGNARPAGTAVDIGAYEFGATAADADADGDADADAGPDADADADGDAAADADADTAPADTDGAADGPADADGGGGDDDGGGCSCRAAGAASGALAWLPVSVVVLVAVRRRARRRA
jgi:hypothetical protein